MTYKICELNLVCIRKDASEDSLMTSQLLFGEIVMVIAEHDQWNYIQSTLDYHEGWVLAAQLQLIDFEYHKLNPHYCLDLVNVLTIQNETVPILLGSNFYQFDGMSFNHGKKKFFYNGNIIHPEKIEADSKYAQKLIFKYLNTPYLFGGKSPFGIDASALIQMVFRMMGIMLPRFHFEQVKFGEIVEFYSHTQVGDLVFFDDNRGTINHVGMLLGDSKIIHVHDKVRIDLIDMYGIIDSDTKKYMYKTRIIKRLLPTDAFKQGAIEDNSFNNTNQISIFES